MCGREDGAVSCRSQVPWIHGHYAEYTNTTTDQGPLEEVVGVSCSPTEMLLEWCSSGMAEATAL